MSPSLIDSLREKYKFEEPKSIEEAEERRKILIQQNLKINIQLSERNRTYENGLRMSVRDYHEWRRKALLAKTFKEAEISFLKEWITQRNRESFLQQQAQQVTKHSQLMHQLRQANTLLKRLKSDGVSFSSKEEGVIATIEEIIRQNTDPSQPVS